jgi:hypothetical protein
MNRFGDKVVSLLALLCSDPIVLAACLLLVSVVTEQIHSILLPFVGH